MKNKDWIFIVLLALAAAPAIASDNSEPLKGMSDLAHCYKFVLRRAQHMEIIRARFAAKVCDGMAIDEAASLVNIKVNRAIRHLNTRISNFAHTGPAACDPSLFDGNPLPSFPIAAESPGLTMELLLMRVQECDGIGGEPPPPP